MADSGKRQTDRWELKGRRAGHPFTVSVFLYLAVLFFPWEITTRVRFPYTTVLRVNMNLSPWNLHPLSGSCPQSSSAESPPSSLGKSWGQQLGYIDCAISDDSPDYRLPVMWFPIVFALDTQSTHLLGIFHINCCQSRFLYLFFFFETVLEHMD